MKPKCFDVIIYGIMFDDVMHIFKTTSDVIENDKNIDIPIVDASPVDHNEEDRSITNMEQSSPIEESFELPSVGLFDYYG